MDRKTLLTILVLLFVILSGCATQTKDVQVKHNSTQTQSIVTKSSTIETISNAENPGKYNVTDGKEFIGLKYSDLPSGITEHEGMVIEGDYCLDYLSKDKIQMVWLEKVFYNNDGKVEYYKVLDVIVSPENNEKYTFALEGNYLNDEYAPNIVTLVKKTTADYWDISHAWVINLEKEKFEKTELDGLKCENTTFED